MHFVSLLSTKPANTSSRRTVLTITLAALTALWLVAFAGFAQATPKWHVVRAGQSIQKAINAADPGDTIVVKGFHREHVKVSRCAGSTPCSSRLRSLPPPPPAGYPAFAFKQTTSP
jgi:hypothetical protein